MPSENGFRDNSSVADAYSSNQFIIQRMLSMVRTSTIVKVLSVSNGGGVSPVGTVDIQPLVAQTDGKGNIVSLPPVYGVPYMRVQGGTDAVILDPKVGDLGIALFGDRDQSAVSSTKGEAAPGSRRKHSLSDAIYIGGILNGTPEQYVQFQDSGITVTSPQKVTIHAPNTEVQGNFKVTGTSELDGAVTAKDTVTATGEVTGKGVELSTHKHTGVQTGGGTSGPPI